MDVLAGWKVRGKQRAGTGWLLAALLGASLGAGGVASSPAGAQEAKRPKRPDNIVRFWYSLPQHEAQAFQALVDRYAQDHPRLVFQVRPFATLPELHHELMTAQELPHLALIDSAWQAELAHRKRLIEAESQMERVGTMARIVAKADTFPSMWEASHVDGRVWTLPMFAHLEALLYDADKLTAAGFKKAPQTWEQVLAYARKLTNPKTLSWGLALPLDQPEELGELLHVERLQWVDAPAQAPSKTLKKLPATPAKAGGKAAAKAPVPAPSPATAVAPASSEAARNPAVPLGPAREDASLAAPEYERVLQYWLDLAHKHKVLSLAADKRAEAAMFVGSLEDLLAGQAAGRKLSAWPMPSFGKPAVHMQLFSLAIFDADPHHVERHWEMAHWLSEFPQQLELSTRVAVLPSNKQVTLSPTYYQFLEAHPGVRSFLGEVPHARPYPHDSNFRATLEPLGRKLREALEHPKPAREVLTEAAAGH